MVCLTRPHCPCERTGTRSDSTNTRPVMALALSPMPTPSMFREAPTPGLLSSLDDWPRPTTPRRCYCARSHRTRPPPADTRRACCHVLSSFQRTGLARPPAIGLSAVVRRTFQTYQPANLVSSLNFGLPEILEPARRRSFVLRRDIHAHGAFDPGRASRRQPCPIARHGAWRFLELEGRDARRLLSTWAAVRLPLRARHLAASLTNIRPRDGRVNRESQETLRSPQVTEAQGVDAQLPASSVARSLRWSSRLRRLAPARRPASAATKPSSSP